MDIATALTRKLNEDSANANLVHEVSSRLSSNLAVHIQSQLPRTDALKVLAHANNLVDDAVSFFRSGAGKLPPMPEHVLGKYLSFTEDAMLKSLIEQFQIAFVVSSNKRAQYGQTYQMMSDRP